ncbi:hypothetical protein HMPREF3293_01462 [Christensenella minuta]|uniref:Uncharacterized protein n=1 Tax=Christensenella minuta TaxID=626937 RepID=A0A136Q515_9FIRM|nr:hypothetical protein HMPREF3293_01462 [Christensenella minuta]
MSKRPPAAAFLTICFTWARINAFCVQNRYDVCDCHNLIYGTAG